MTFLYFQNVKPVYLVIFILSLNASAQTVHEDIHEVLKFTFDSVILKGVGPAYRLSVSPLPKYPKEEADNCVNAVTSIPNFTKNDIDSIWKKLKDPDPDFKFADFLGNYDRAAISSKNLRQDPGMVTVITEISQPVFFRDQNFCFLIYSLPRSGGGGILLQKLHGRWRLCQRLCQWYN